MILYLTVFSSFEDFCTLDRLWPEPVSGEEGLHLWICPQHGHWGQHLVDRHVHIEQIQLKSNNSVAHSGLVGGGLEIFGSIFFVAFLALYGIILCIRVGKNTNNHLQKSRSVQNTRLFWPNVSISLVYFIIAYFYSGRLWAASQTPSTTFLFNLGPKLNLLTADQLPTLWAILSNGLF